MSLFSSEAPTYRKVIGIAKGGMGQVDLVVRRQENFERLYALKRLRESYRDDEDIRRMFVDEARIAGLIRHPNVVSVTDVGEDKEGPFLVMDYVDGVSLSSLLQTLIKRKISLPATAALSIMAQVADGIHAAHTLQDGRGQNLSVIHRDVSPQNVLVGFDGFARVTDFGIAKAFGRSSKTDTGILKGKLGYLSPEALRFEELDHRSDIFSIGVVLYELLTMSRLYGSKNGMEAARAILHEPPPDLAEDIDHAPPELVELLLSLLAKQPNHRPSTASEVSRRLRAILRDLEMDLPPVDVADFLAEAFGEERAAFSQKVESARLMLAKKRFRSRRGSASRWAVPVLAVFLLAGGALYWLSDASQSSTDDAHALPSADSRRMDSPMSQTNHSVGATDENTDRDLLDPPSEQDEQVGEPSDMGASPGGSESARSERRARQRQRERDRRRRGMSDPPTGSSSGATPMWGWQ